MTDPLDPLTPSINGSPSLGLMDKIRRRFTRGVTAVRAPGEGIRFVIINYIG